MWKHIFSYSILACGVLVVGLFDKIISKGRWLVDSVEKCPNADRYPVEIALRKKKLNRTHDGFSVEAEVPFDIDDDYGILIEACKKVDGGCKLMQVFQDKSFCKFIQEHAEENFERGMVMMGLKPECPFPKGHHKLTDFLFDNREIPEDGMLGEFRSTVYMTKGIKYVLCLIVNVSFNSKEDDDT